MKLHHFLAIRLIYLGLGGVMALAGLPAFAAELKLEAQLVWGTNDEKSPDPKHKKVDPKVEKKLKSMPFKWQHYFQVNNKEFSVAEGETKKLTLSNDLEIKVRNVGKGVIEVKLFGKGEPVGKVSQALPKDELLLVGGNAANFTSWFVVLRQPD